MSTLVVSGWRFPFKDAFFIAGVPVQQLENGVQETPSKNASETFPIRSVTSLSQPEGGEVTPARKTHGSR
jgi:hypothetical protein